MTQNQLQMNDAADTGVLGWDAPGRSAGSCLTSHVVNSIEGAASALDFGEEMSARGARILDHRKIKTGFGRIDRLPALRRNDRRGRELRLTRPAWYNSLLTYHANGTLATLSIPGVPTISYGLDGERRPSAVSAATGQNPGTTTSSGWIRKPDARISTN